VRTSKNVAIEPSARCSAESWSSTVRASARSPEAAPTAVTAESYVHERFASRTADGSPAVRRPGRGGEQGGGACG